MAYILIAILVTSTAAWAGDMEPPVIPSRFTCKIVLTLYGHYKKEGYSADQMKDYLRSKNIPERRISEAEKCLG